MRTYSCSVRLDLQPHQAGFQPLKPTCMGGATTGVSSHICLRLRRRSRLRMHLRYVRFHLPNEHWFEPVLVGNSKVP